MSAQVLQSQANPVLEQHAAQHAAARVDADGKQAPERDDPRARLESQLQENGAPTVAHTRQIQALRLNNSSAARALSTGGRGLHGAAAAVTGLPVWVPIGPTGADTQQNGSSTLFTADSGRARVILPDPGNADHLYFLTSGGGLWVTNDFTTATPTWTALTDSLPTTGGGSVTFGRNALTLYLGTGDPFDVINTGGSVTKSIDGGLNWSIPVDLGAAQSVRDIKVDTTTVNDIVLAATDVGLFRSPDGGATFAQVPLGGVSGLAVWSIVKTSAGWLANAQSCAKIPAELCATASTIYLSTDQGATWNATGAGFGSAGRTTLAVGNPGDAVVYAFAENTASTDQGNLFRSADGGLNFTPLNINAKIPTNAAGNGDQPNMDLMHNQSWYNQMIVVDPTDPNVVYLGGNLSSAKSIDGGATWTLTSNWLAQFGLPYVHADMHAAAIIPNANPALHTVIFGTDGGIFVSPDSGATFANKNAGLQTHLIYSLASSPVNPNGIIAGFQDVGTRSRVGNSTIYNQIIGGDGFSTAWTQNGAFAMGTVEFGDIFPNVSPVVSEAGESWDDFVLPNAATEGLFNTSVATPSLAADPTGQVLFSYTSLHVYKSANAGANWTQIGALGAGGNVPTLTGFRSTTHGMSVGPIDQLHLAVAGPNGNLAFTSNGGTTWSVVPIGGQVTSFANISSITWADNATLYVTSEAPTANVPRIVKSIDGGTTWNRADTTLPDAQVNRIIVDPRDATHNTLLAATELGVFQSTNGGTSWAVFGTGLPNVRVNDIYMPPDGSFIRIATYGRGIWEMPSLSFKSASLTDDVTSCDHDGSLDNNEVGHLTVVLHNDSGVTFSAITATVTSTTGGVSFPSGASISFPAAAPGADTTGTLVVALAGATGVQQLNFNIAFTDPTLNLTTAVTASTAFRGNFDVVANSSTRDDFEAPTSVWTTAGTAESIPDIFSWHNREFSPVDHRWIGIDSNVASDTSLVSPSLVLGAAGPFSFSVSQRFVFESTATRFFDGGVIEISQDGGTTWQDVTAIGGTMFLAYNHTIDATAGNNNPLAGRLAFSGISAGYPNMSTETVTLPATLAGKTINIRFRIGTDVAGGESGWTIDNFSFTGLTNTPFPAVVVDRGACGVSATTTTVASGTNPSTLGNSVTFTATVVGGASTPTGAVTFNDGATSIGTGALANGLATLTTSTLAVGSHIITAIYGGDTTHSTSTSAGITQVVNSITTSTTVTSSLNPSNTGQLVTFTATVASASTATGTVTFNDGAIALGTGNVDASGVATFSTSTLPAGTHSITAVYGGDATHLASTSAAISQVINGVATPTTTALTSSPNPSTANQSVTFTATVTGGATPTGNVTFSDGPTSIGTGALNASGVATFSTTSLAVGTHAITAAYAGDATHSSSTSAPVSQVVTAITTSTAVVSSVNPSAANQSVTFTATVTGGSTPTGNVTFSDGGTALGTSALNASGVATFATAALAVGTHPITAAYIGDATHSGSASVAVSQVVTTIATSTSLTSSVNPSLATQSVSFTATVTGGATATGNVTFSDGATALGTSALNASGVATFATTALAVGTHSITAVYAGDAIHSGSTSAAVSQVVNPQSAVADYKVSADKASVTLLAGQSATFTISSQSINGFAGTVTFACNNLPQLTTCAFTPASVNVTAAGTNVTSTLVVRTSGPHAALTFPFLHSNHASYAVVACILPFGIGFVFIGGATLSGRKRALLAIAVLALITLGFVGCGGGTTTPPPPTTPAGSTVFSVSTTATAGTGSPAPANPTQNLSITITVQP